MQSFLNASAWKLDFEVSFTAKAEGSFPAYGGTINYKSSLDQSFTGTIQFDVRSDGPNLSTARMMSANDTGGAPSAAQQQKLMEMMMHADAIANWIIGGADLDESDSDEAQQAAMIESMHTGTVRIDYTRVDNGVGLEDVANRKFNQTTRTTIKGEGPVMPLTQLSFELDSRTGKYLLSLSPDFGDMSDNTLHEEVVTRTESAGEAPSESTEKNDHGLTWFPQALTIDDPSILMGDLPIMEGTANPKLGKITGEKTVPAHYDESFGPCAGTLTFRYTLTPR